MQMTKWKAQNTVVMEKHFNLFTEDASPKKLPGKFVEFIRLSL